MDRNRDLRGRAVGTINGVIIGWTEEDPPRLYALSNFEKPDAALNAIQGAIFHVPVGYPSFVNGEQAFVFTYGEEQDQHVRNIIDTLIHLREQHPDLVQLELNLGSK